MTAVAKTCLRCGSSKMISGASLRDHYGDLGMRSSPAQVAVDANPDAIVFKGRAYGDLILEICGACGHVEMTAENFAELYAQFRKSKEA